MPTWMLCVSFVSGLVALLGAIIANVRIDDLEKRVDALEGRLVRVEGCNRTWR